MFPLGVHHYPFVWGVKNLSGVVVAHPDLLEERSSASLSRNPNRRSIAQTDIITRRDQLTTFTRSHPEMTLKRTHGTYHNFYARMIFHTPRPWHYHDNIQK